jgi:hypothetical protein
MIGHYGEATRSIFYIEASTIEPGVTRDALLSIPRLRGVYSCGVRDLSDKDVGLRLNDFPLLSTQFDISLDGFRTTLACQ